MASASSMATFVYALNGKSSFAELLPALDGVNYLSIVGEIFRVPKAPGHIYHRPFYCTQRTNDTRINGDAVYPADTPGVVKATYPVSPFLYPQSWIDYVDSLSKKSGLSSKQLLLIAVLVPVSPHLYSGSHCVWVCLDSTNSTT